MTPALFFAIWAAAGGANAQGTLKQAPALIQLESAARNTPTGSAEGLVAQGSTWSDGGGTGRESLTVAGAPGGLLEAPPAAAGVSGERRARAAVPPVEDGRVRGSQDERYVQFGYGFLEIEKPALDLMMGSWPVKILGVLVGAVLFIPAVIWGGIRAFF